MTLQPGEARFEVGQDGSTVVAEGEIDVATAPRLRAVLDQLLQDGVREIRVDMGGVTFIDSSGLGVLVGAQKQANQRDGTIKVVSLQGAARKVFEITGLLDVFAVDA